MEVNPAPQVALQQQQTAQQQTPNATNAPGVAQTVQSVPDQVVTAATNAEETNVREDDAQRNRQDNSREPNIASLEDLKLAGLKTRVGFDTEHDLVYLEILTPKTEDVIQRIPSEHLVEYLADEFQEALESGPVREAAQSFDRSI